MANTDFITNHEVYRGAYIVGVGDLERGILFFGPFADLDAAHEWALGNVRSNVMHRVMPLQLVSVDATDAEGRA